VTPCPICSALGQCCDLYNAALQERRDAWRKQKIPIGYNGQQKGLTEWRRSDPDGAAVPVEVQRSALRTVEAKTTTARPGQRARQLSRQSSNPSRTGNACAAPKGAFGLVVQGGPRE
jgi:hypothetical protein